MKHIAKSLVVAGAMIAAGSVSADVLADLNPYIGADYYQAWMKPKGDYTKILPKDFPGATLYVGTKFHENFGIELGYDWSAQKKKDFNLAKGSTLFSTGAAGLTNPVSGSVKVRRSGAHIDLVGFLPVAECFDLIGSVGFGWLQTKLTTSAVSTSATSQHTSAVNSLSGKGRGVLRVGVGGSYMVTDMVGLRAKLSWESTSSLRVNGNGYFTSLAFGQNPYKSTTALAIGAFVKF